MPLYYVSIPGFAEADQEDEAVALVARFQYVDWRDLRVMSYRRTAFRSRLHELASQLLEAEHEADAKAISEAEFPFVTSDDDAGTGSDTEEPPGLLDKLAEGEAALQRLGPQLEHAGKVVKEIGEFLDEATRSIQRSDTLGRGFAGRLTVTRQLAKKLELPAQEYEATTSAFAADVLQANPMMDTIFDQLAASPLQLTQAQPFLQAITATTCTHSPRISSTTTFAEAVAEMKGWSKELRPFARRIEVGSRQIADTQRIFDEWGRRANALVEERQPRKRPGAKRAPSAHPGGSPR